MCRTGHRLPDCTLTLLRNHRFMFNVIHIVYWLAAARAGFAGPADWRHWADKIVIALSKPPSWVLDLSLATDTKDLERIVAEVVSKIPKSAPTSMDDAILGYIWWRYERGDLPLRHCLQMAGEAADAGGARISCERVFDLLKKLEAGISEELIKGRASELFAPLQQMAKEQWHSIQSAL